MQRRKVQRAFMQAQTCRRYVKSRAEKDKVASVTFSRSRYTAFSRSRATEFRDVGTPACTREEKQSTEHVKGSNV